MKLDLSGPEIYIKEPTTGVDLEFRPSASKRWFTCPASIRMSSHFGEDTTSDAALEGTLAHKVAENYLKYALFPDRHVEDPDSSDVKVTKAMDKHVKNYVDRVKNLVDTTSCEFFIEQNFKYEISSSVTLSGTCDLVILDHSNELVRVIDLKYGRMKVNLTNNSQLNIYALLASKFFTEYEHVTIQIMQPRIDHYPSIDLDKHYLLEFEKTLRSKIHDCLEPNPRFVTGDHCYFCPAKESCSAYKLPKLNQAYGF